MRKKILVAVMSVGLVIGSAIHANAAQCLDVRDYGYHRYNYRTYEGGTAEIEVNRRDENVVTYDSKGRRKEEMHTVATMRVFRYYTYICVCGLGYSEAKIDHDYTKVLY